MSRAANRAEAERHKARVRRWLARWRFFKADTPDRVGRRARTPHPCSCLGCGNERRHLGPTLQELRAAVSDRDIPSEVERALERPDPDDFDWWCALDGDDDWVWDMVETSPRPLRVDFLSAARVR